MVGFLAGLGAAAVLGAVGLIYWTIAILKMGEDVQWTGQH